MSISVNSNHFIYAILFISVQVIAVTSQCIDFGLRNIETDDFNWKFYIFTGTTNNNSCFLCAKIPPGTTAVAVLILPCLSPPISSVTIASFESDARHVGSWNLVTSDNGCAPVYSASTPVTREAGTNDSIAMDPHNLFNFTMTIMLSSDSYGKMFRLKTKTNLERETIICIRDVMYAIPSTTEASPTSPRYRLDNVGESNTLSPGANTREYVDIPRENLNDTSFPVWILVSIVACSFLVGLLFVVAVGGLWSRTSNDQSKTTKAKGINNNSGSNDNAGDIHLVTIEDEKMTEK